MTEEVSKEEDAMGSEIERLGRRLADKAAAEGGFMAGVLELWAEANPDRPAEKVLHCDSSIIWRLAVTPRPVSANFVPQALAIAEELGLNPFGLLNMLRFAETTEAFRGQNVEGEMMMAALDAGQTGEDSD